MIVGIDLGTTNSLVGVWRDGGVSLIPNPLGDVMTPSAVSVADDGSILVGQSARDRLSTHPGLSAAAFKRAMGTQFRFSLGDRPFRAEELSALVLRSLKADAERFLGEPVTEAVVTVPAYFSDAQRKATRAAGQLAGLDVRRLLNEPTAAALAYGLHEQAERRIMVLDLGGGTFDVSILELFEGVMEVRATSGDNFLGGEDFTAALMDGFLAAVGGAAGIPARGRDLAVHSALRRSAETAKRALADSDSCDVVLVHEGRELRWTVGRDDLEALSGPLLVRIRAPVERALRDARIQPGDVEHLVLAGGATRMPAFRRLVARMFQRLPIATVDPDEVVARGAAIQAGMVARDAALSDRVMTDVSPFTMGIEVSESHDQQVVESGLYLPVIERNTVVPASRSVTVQTLRDGQRVIAVRAFQGESRRVADNIPLGELSVSVPAGRAGSQSVEVRFTYDASGLLEVVTMVGATGSRQRLVIENQPGVLSAAEIERRLAALAHLRVSPRDQAENVAVVARAERVYAERLGEERDDVGRRLGRFRRVLAGQDPAEIATVRDEFDAWLDVVDVGFFR